MGPGGKKVLFLAALFLIAWLSLKFLLPILSPFLLGLGLALAAEPMAGFLTRRLHLPRGAAAGIGVTLAFALLMAVLLLLGALLVRELGALAGVLPELEEAVQSGVSLLRTWLLDLAARTPPGIRPLLRDGVATLFTDGAALVDQFLRFFLSLAGSLLSHIPASALGLGTAVISGFMFSAKLPRIRTWLRRRLSREKLRPLLDTLGRMRSAAGAWLKAQLRLMAVTFLILLGGLWALRVPYAPGWAAAICLVDAFPVLGTGTVLLPWALISLLQGDQVLALGLLGLYGGASLTRSILEPRLVGHQLGLDPLVTLIALYAGYKLWGIGGMLLSPLLAVTALQAAPRSPGGDS